MQRRRRLEKPLLGTQLNWGHPLATGLIFCMALNEGGPNWDNRSALPVVLDACGNFPIAFISAASNLVYGVPGPGYNFPSTVRYFTPAGLAGTLVNSIPTDGVTILVIRRKTDTTSRQSSLFGCTSATLSHRCQAHVPYSDGKMYWDFGEASGANRLTVTGLSWPATTEYLAFTAGGAGMAFWRNGQKLGSQSTGVTRVQGASDEFRINNGPATNGDLQDIFFFAVSARQWDDSLVAWWMAEPYGMFVPQAPRVAYFIPSGGLLAAPRVFVVT